MPIKATFQSTLGLSILLTALPLGAASLRVINFNDVNLSSPAVQSYGGPGGGVFYNGSDEAGGFAAGGAHFNNSFVDFGGGFTAWQGWAWSTTTDTTTSGFGNQYSAYSGGAYSGNAYGVSYAAENTSVITLPSGWHQPQSVRITNTTYAALDMLNGSAFSKQFGGPSGNDPDWLLLTITGRDGGGTITGALDFYLADYRFTDNSLNYIIDQWELVNLTSLGANVATLTFTMASSDMGDFGMNTPAYFAMDELVLVPEPSGAVWLLACITLSFAGFRRFGRK